MRSKKVKKLPILTPPGPNAPLVAKLNYVDRVTGLLADGPDLLEAWYREHRLEGEHEKF